jgi:hypothetical protein
MTSTTRAASVGLILLGLALAGCGGSATHPPAPASRLENMAGSSAGKIVLTPAGAEHIGIRIAPVLSATALAGSTTASASLTAGGPIAVIPYSAIVFDPSGRTYAFTSPARLTYTEVPITIDHVSGDSAYLLAGPHPGAEVVTVGAEELFGVQTGVTAQT